MSRDVDPELYDGKFERVAVGVGKVVLLLLRVSLYPLAAIGLAALLGGFNVL